MNSDMDYSLIPLQEDRPELEGYNIIYVELSKDGTCVEVLFKNKEFDNQYIEIPIEFIKPILTSYINSK